MHPSEWMNSMPLKQAIVSYIAFSPVWAFFTFVIWMVAFDPVLTGSDGILAVWATLLYPPSILASVILGVFGLGIESKRIVRVAIKLPIIAIIASVILCLIEGILHLIV